MSRILLKELLKNVVTEQAPQPPPEQPATPPPAEPLSQPAGETPAPTPEPTGATPPPPEDSGEYDFTRDFKVYESSVEKAKQMAKKKFLTRLNQMVKDKKVTVNASRGQPGQPQKDYTIDKVVKGSIDWYYNKDVVVLTDENGKEFLLTPGVNIKIEQSVATPEQPASPAEKPQDQAPAEPPKMKAPEPAPEEQPSPEPPAEPAPAAGLGTPGGAPAAKPSPTGTTPSPGQAQPTEPGAPEDQQSQLLKKKKKAAPAPTMEEESADESDSKPLKAEDMVPMNYLFAGFVPQARRDQYNSFDVRPYFKHGTTTGDGEYWTSEFTIEIPMEVFNNQLDLREFKLEAQDYMRHYSGPGAAFSRGGVEVSKHGRFYVFDFYESGGLDI